MDFLRRSADDYDAGHREEAIRVAQALRILFHDTKHSTSLLSLLGIKQSARVLTIIPDSYVRVPGTNRYRARLTPMFSPNTGFVVSFENLEREDFVSVSAWWDQWVLVRADPLSRRDVVLSAANHDGGAHVAANPGAKTRQLLDGVGSYQAASHSDPIPLDNVHFPLLRQFAYEVLSSPDMRA